MTELAGVAEPGARVKVRVPIVIEPDALPVAAVYASTRPKASVLATCAADGATFASTSVRARATQPKAVAMRMRIKSDASLSIIGAK